MERLGRVGWGVLFGALALYLVLPVLAAVLYSVATSWTARALPDGYTLDHWRAGITDPRLLAALGRTIGLALAALVVDLLLVTPAVYWQRVRNPRIRMLTELAAAAPFVLPFIVIAFGILRLAGSVLPAAIGSPVLLLFAHAAICFPFLYWAVDGAMAAANVVALNEAAQTCGAKPWQILWHVIVPNISAGLAAGGMLVFAVSFGEFALVQILAGARFENVSLFSLDLLTRTSADFSRLAVLTVISMTVLFAVSTAVVLLNRGQATGLAPGARVMAGERDL